MIKPKILCDICENEMELWVVPEYDMNARFIGTGAMYLCRNCNASITKSFKEVLENSIR